MALGGGMWQGRDEQLRALGSRGIELRHRPTPGSSLRGCAAPRASASVSTLLSQGEAPSFSSELLLWVRTLRGRWAPIGVVMCGQPLPLSGLFARSQLAELASISQGLV